MRISDRNYVAYIICLILCTVGASSVHSADFTPASPEMSDYFKTPPYISIAEEPSVMLILDNSGSMFNLAYRGTNVSTSRNTRRGTSCGTTVGGDFDPLNEYYGYFNPLSYYSYNSTDSNNEFFEVCIGTTCNDTNTWSGNFLNWLTMRRIDVAKRVLTGGKIDADTDPHSDILEAEPSPDRDFNKAYDDRTAVTDLNGNTRHMTPFHQPMYITMRNATPTTIDFQSVNLTTTCGDPTYDRSSATTLSLGTDSRFDIRVKILPALLVDGGVEGVIQQTDSDIRFGLTVFDDEWDGSDTNNTLNGGEVREYIGRSNDDIVAAINDVRPVSWTPLAETLWTVTGYFQQSTLDTANAGPRYEADAYTVNDDWDPFFFNDKQLKVPCSEAFVLLITDGEPTQDLNIPANLRDYDEDGIGLGTYGSNGSDYLDDVALYAHTNDLRPDADEPVMVGNQTLTLYPVFAFGSGANLLVDAAINGGFTDRNGDNKPNTLAEELLITDLSKREWDHDNDSEHLPDNYATAESGADLVQALKKAFGDIQKRMASGTAASVISSSRSGEGAIYQALFYPSRSDNENREVAWTGDIHGLLVDGYSNMREDTLGNSILDMVDDYIIKMFFDIDANKTRAYRFKDIDGDGNIDSPEDVDGDNCLDVIEIDHDGDGHFDVIEDKNGDGDCWDDEDYDNDGHLDVIETDLDNDGHADVDEDVDGDGYLDRGEDVICNGYIDYTETDYNSNGLLDGFEDLDGDGHRDTVHEDLDYDCRIDKVDEDIDGDGNFDDVYEDLNDNKLFDLDVDDDGDGDCDDFIDTDTDGDGVCDTYEDLDGDGNFDVGEDVNLNNILDDGEDIDEDGELDYTEDLDRDNRFDTGEDVNHNNILDPGEDLDGDGVLDRTEDLDGDDHFDIGEDINCNGSLENREDIDGDGHFDQAEDANNNGLLDGSEDLDLDGRLDVGEDLNCNQQYDVGEPDLNGNGSWDPDEDVDDDGNLDVAETDADGDGNADIFEDLDGDGNLDRGEDLNCDGVIDIGEDRNNDGLLAETEDLDGDGQFDRYNEDITVPGNVDGTIDVFEDLDFDGNLDIDEDLDGDGRFEKNCEEDHNGNGLFDVDKDNTSDGDCDDPEDVDTDGDGICDENEDDDRDGHRDCGGDLNDDGDCDDVGEFLIQGACHTDEDIDNDNHPDSFEDIDGDGHLDLVEDQNHNGIADDPDLNGNGNWDINEDLDGDGHLDISEDLDGDGKWDFEHEDVDDDCTLDVLEDIDGDGKLDPVDEDIDGDGELDATYEDSNHNCVLDTGSEDLDGDNKLDVLEWDIDGDGRVDGYEDLDNDCNLDSQEDLDGDGRLDTVNEDGSDGSIPDGFLDVAERDVDGDGTCDLVADINYDTGPGCDGGTPKFDTVNEDLDGDGKLDYGEPRIDIVDVNDLKFLWSAGEQLANVAMVPENTPPSYGTSSPQRYIFTFIDENDDEVVDSGEVMSFDSATLANDIYFGYFLGTGNGADRDVNGDSTVDNDDVSDLIDFIRGKDFPSVAAIRSRNIRIDTDKDGNVDGADSVVTWRLGDIIQSTPTVVQRPSENYDLLYRNDSYRRFKKAYADRRTVVLSGANDGLFHAFNGGFYKDYYKEPTAPYTITRNKFWLNCYRNASNEEVCDDSSSKPRLGQELWAYAPYNLLPHLQWLAKQDYTHVYYADLKPKIIDAQLWPDQPVTDSVHVGGWGTIMIGGMRFGGGPIQVSAAEGTGDDTDLRTLRSSYFVLDITDPEQPPALLGEFVLDEPDRFSFTTVYPAVIPIYNTNATPNEWGVKVPLEWYILVGSGPTNLDGESKQEGRVYAMKLKNYQCNGQGISCTNKTLGQWQDKGRSDGDDYLFKLKEPNSFLGDPVVIDYQLGNPDANPGAFIADAAYFGTVAGNFKNDELDSDIGEDLDGDGVLDYGEDANGNGQLDVDEDANTNTVLDPTEDVGGWTGRLHRVVIDDMVDGSGENPHDSTTWTHSLFYDPRQPIVGNPTVGVDKQGNFWVYFGTGRYYDIDDRDDVSLHNFYGITEQRAFPPSLAGNPLYTGSMTSPSRTSTDLLETTNVAVYEGDSPAEAEVANLSGVSNFQQLETLFDYTYSGSTPVTPAYNGWYVDMSVTGERNLGRGALAGDIMTFTSYIPSNEICKSEGRSKLYAFYYRTGTAYWSSVIGTDDTDTRIVDEEVKEKVNRDTDLGTGFALSPNIFRGREDESKAFVQTSTGEIVEIEQKNPGIIKSGKTSWKQAE